MSKIKVSELFYSIQGEGRYMGVPSVFLRTFGCNFTCSGFNMPRGEVSVERFAVDEELFTDYKRSQHHQLASNKLDHKNHVDYIVQLHPILHQHLLRLRLQT